MAKYEGSWEVQEGLVKMVATTYIPIKAISVGADMFGLRETSNLLDTFATGIPYSIGMRTLTNHKNNKLSKDDWVARAIPLVGLGACLVPEMLESSLNLLTYLFMSPETHSLVQTSQSFGGYDVQTGIELATKQNYGLGTDIRNFVNDHTFYLFDHIAGAFSNIGFAKGARHLWDKYIGGKDEQPDAKK